MDFIQSQKNNFKYRSQLIDRATKEEVLLKRWLDEVNVRYLFQKGFLKPFHRIVDFYIPKKKIIIEIDGGYHKNTRLKDSQKDTIWGQKGFKTYRILNEQVLDGSFVQLLSNILKIT